MSAAIQTPEPAPLELVEEIETHRDEVIETSRDLVIDSDDDYARAGQILAAIRTEKKRILEKVTPTVEAANAAHKAATKLRGELLAPANEAETTVKGAMATYVDRKEAEAEAERRRQIEAEQKREAEERRLQRELEREEEERLAKAAELEAAGQVDAADELLEQAIAPPPPPAPLPVPRRAAKAPKSAHAATRKNWSMQILDKRALVEAWLAGEVPDELITINEGALNRIAKSMKEAARIPGCQAVAETVIAGR